MPGSTSNPIVAGRSPSAAGGVVRQMASDRARRPRSCRRRRGICMAMGVRRSEPLVLLPLSGGGRIRRPDGGMPCMWWVAARRSNLNAVGRGDSVAGLAATWASRLLRSWRFDVDRIAFEVAAQVARGDALRRCVSQFCSAACEPSSAETFLSARNLARRVELIVLASRALLAGCSEQQQTPPYLQARR